MRARMAVPEGGVGAPTRWRSCQRNNINTKIVEPTAACTHSTSCDPRAVSHR